MSVKKKKAGHAKESPIKQKKEGNHKGKALSTPEGTWNAERLRKLWKDYFKKHEHKDTTSASLLPSGDPSLLFTSAGMVPFKDYFSGRSKAPSPRIVSIQKCLRTTDLDSVGKTQRHCSFFEMLGNFSFGDYFKREAIFYAWDFSLHHLKLDPERIYVTVYHDDREAEEIWKNEIGLDPQHIRALGKMDNWWGPAGEQGPCGPCSELYLDLGEELCKTCACKDKEQCGPGGEGERFLEYWNLVFNEFYSDAEGKLHPLPEKGIDTGAGLERILALLEKKESIYDTAEMQKIINSVEEISAKLRSDGKKLLCNAKNQTAFRVVSDHLRSSVFSIADRIFPSNTGRGYVVRRIIRRALLYARELGIFTPILHELSPVIVEIYGKTYPELREYQTDVKDRLLVEERRFLETLELGLKQWQGLLEKRKKEKKDSFSGQDAFLLYDTYGFPLELTSELAQKAKLKLDTKGFEKEMEKQRVRSTKGSQWKDLALPVLKPGPSKFLGYESFQHKAKILAIVDIEKCQSISSCSAKEFLGKGLIVILDETPFYAEGGGQLGDKGQLLSLDLGNESLFSVEDTQKSGSFILHIGQLKNGRLKLGEEIQASIDQERRVGLMRHHSATHLLNKALNSILGDHVMQTGSLVAPDHLRFDFSHPEKISEEALSKISAQVNSAIGAKAEVGARIMSLAKARENGAVATFGEKYGEEVRVLSMGTKGEFSKELCGGCHVKNTAEIAFFYIVKESSPGAGNRRIEAIAGEQVREYFQKEWEALKTEIHKHNQGLEATAKTQKEGKGRDLLLALKVELTSISEKSSLLEKPEDILPLKEKISELRAQWEEARKQRNKIMKKYATEGLASQVEKYLGQIQKLGSLGLLSLKLSGQEAGQAREFMDKVKEKSRGIVILLGIDNREGKSSLFFSADKRALELVRGLDMALLIREAAFHIKGSGGGRRDMAQAGGKYSMGLEDALHHAKEKIETLVKEEKSNVCLKGQ